LARGHDSQDGYLQKNVENVGWRQEAGLPIAVIKMMAASVTINA